MDSEKKETFYDRVLEFRPILQELSLTEAAGWAGVSKQTWLTYIRGATPSFVKAEIIREGLDMTEGQMYWCLTGYGDLVALKPEGGSPHPIRKRKKEAV